MKAVFLSDVHLKHRTDERYVRLLRFLNHVLAGNLKSPIHHNSPEENRRIDALYILGDFFDFWFCNKNCIYPDFQMVIQKIVELKKTGVHIHWCEGNHDFFMKEYFQEELGMDVSEEWAIICLDSLKVLISHGDTVDRSNWRYLALRKVLRSQPFYRFQRLIPPSLRWTMAGASSNASKRMNDNNNDFLAEKMHRFAKIKLQDEYDAVIMGHCHKPLLHQFIAKGRQKTSATLGDWRTCFSFLYYENEQFFLIKD
ncbi:MAG: UDP-2,3-diacylglucosamine diphosphatase [Syntrophaceae bacterium]|jgi:UDP-2,3-diacylglucosamine hydrolase|nr:UDP-2,3-diacylglucosamine diphosphatase [Syntrophaceae bacterium]